MGIQKPDMAPRRLWCVTCVMALTLVLNTVEADANNLGHDTNEGLSDEIFDASSLTATTARDASKEVSHEATNSDRINANANNLGHDTNEMAHEAATPSASVLRAELSALKVGGLNRRAVAANVDPNALEMAQDKGDKAAIIELVLQSSGAHDIAGTPVSHEATNSAAGREEEFGEDDEDDELAEYISKLPNPNLSACWKRSHTGYADV